MRHGKIPPMEIADLLLPALFSFFLLIFLVDAGDRRVLHQPLVPIDWTYSPPSQDVTYTPLPPTVTGPITAVDPTEVVPDEGRKQNGTAVKTTVGVIVSAAVLSLIGICGFFIFRRRMSTPTDPDKLVVTSAGAGNIATFRPSIASTTSSGLYLGTMDPSSREDPDRVRKLRSGRVLESGYRPSPELQPLPPLVNSPPRRKEDPPPVSLVFSDDDSSYYTPQPSTTLSVKSETSSTTNTSRHSVATGGGSGKDTAMDYSPIAVPKSRRTSPRSRLSNSSTADVRMVIPKPNGKSSTPPPPPPPPPPQPHKAIAKVLVPNEQSGMPFPVRPPMSSSRRQWARPTCRAEIPIPKPEAADMDDRDGMEKMDSSNSRKPRLKALHWDKVRASSDHAMVWDHLKSNSFQLDEDMIESLFSNNSNNPPAPPLAPPSASNRGENRVLDPKKSQNIAILLRALNVTREEMSEALLDGNPEGLTADLLETLVKMAPTKEEELRLRDYNGDLTKLGSAERFLKAVLDVPFAFKRVDAMLYRANFDTEVNYLKKSFDVLEVTVNHHLQTNRLPNFKPTIMVRLLFSQAACDELKRSRLFLKLLQAVLKTGNRINVGTNRGEAKAFKLDTLLKLADVKGVDGKTTLLHFVVQEMIRSESLLSPELKKADDFKKGGGGGGLKMVAGLGKELANVKKAAGMDAAVLNSYVSKLEVGVEKINSLMQLETTSTPGNFFRSMKAFLIQAEEEIGRVKAGEKASLTLVKEVTEYFHGNTAKEEAHPFRIFLVVRDFLSVLGNVCKEVERMQTMSSVVGAGNGGSFRMSSSSTLPASA